jgi:hypothetical protein
MKDSNGKKRSTDINPFKLWPVYVPPKPVEPQCFAVVFAGCVNDIHGYAVVVAHDCKEAERLLSSYLAKVYGPTHSKVFTEDGVTRALGIPTSVKAFGQVKIIFDGEF